MQIKIGVPVKAEDGDAGRVERVIIHPDTREVEGIVAVKGWLLPRDVVIPIERVVGADENGVTVSGTAAEIADLPQFAQSQYTEPPEDWIPPGDDAASTYLLPRSPYAVGAFTPPASHPEPPAQEVQDLEPGDYDVTGNTTVYCTDGMAGKVDRVVTEGDTDVVSHLVVHRAGLGVNDVAIPVSEVERIDDEGVHLVLSRSQLDQLPDAEGLEAD